MSKNDNDAVKEDVDDEIKVDTAGGLVTIRELMSKVHEDGLEIVKGVVVMLMRLRNFIKH